MIFVVILSVMVSYTADPASSSGPEGDAAGHAGPPSFLPNAMMLIPLFMIYRNIGVLNSLICVIISIVTFQFPRNNTVLMTALCPACPWSGGGGHDRRLQPHPIHCTWCCRF
jgi:multiple sugar transport system permease protein